MKTVFIIAELFVLIPILFLLTIAFLLCGDLSLLKFILIDIILILFVTVLYKILYENNKN